MQSSEFQNVILKQNQVLDTITNALNRGISLQSIRTATLDAIQNNNYQSIYSLLFSSSQSGDAFFNELVNAKTAFVLQNGFIMENQQTFTCSTCFSTLTDQANYFFDNFQTFNSYRYSPTGSNSKPTCGSWWNQVKLVACAALCGVSTAGIGAGVCGWGCWCTFCTKNSAVANVICAN